MKNSQKLLFLLVAFLLLNCNANTLPKYGLISELRILGLKTSNPEVSPGDVIPIVQSLVSDPDGGGRTITYTWVGCKEQVSALPTRYDCVGAPDVVSFGSGTASNPGAATIPTNFLDGLPTSLAFNGFNYIVALTVTAGTQTVRSFKRIVVSSVSKTAKNNNPILTSISRNGIGLSNGDPVGGSGLENLSVAIPQAGYENYTYFDSSGILHSATEDLLITWFYTEGSMPTSRTFGGVFTNQWTPPAPKTRTTVTLAVVIHDGRGGTDWQTVNLQ